MSDVLAAISWWLSVEIVGLAALPMALRWLRWLPDRGYFFAKPVGILLVSYLLWLGTSLSILDNATATIALLTIGLGVACWVRGSGEAIAYWRARRGFILGSEALFGLAFAVWALVRAYNPEIAATEKPMEIAFLSAAVRSVHFPPVDPWLSGYGISYYYFGYVMMATLAKLAGVAAPVAFNLAIALLFAMTVAGAFALGYNLVARGRAARGGGESGGAVTGGLLASLLVAISANLEAIVELLNAHGALSPGVWRWLQIKDMPAPYQSPGWLPTDNWWWFRAARVIGDFDPVTKASRDYTINEFPFFSFMLGDLHPHLLALPFAVLAVAVALNLWYSGEEWTAAALRRRHLDWLMIGLVFGGLGFLNSWDMPAYLLLLVAAFGVHRYVRQRSWNRALLDEVVKFGLLALLASIVLYLPFYIGFRSQAAGLGVVLERTKLQHFAIFWGPLFFLLVSWLVAEWRGVAGWLPPRSGWGTAAVGAHGGAPLRIASEAGAPRMGDRPRRASQRLAPTAGVVAGEVKGQRRVGGGSGLPVAGMIALGVAVVGLVLLRAGVAALLLALLVLGGGALWRRLQGEGADDAGHFVWLLLLVGTFLLLICEWVFIRDYFDNRMNTVFKLYYQAWLMLAVAGAYVLYFLAARRPRMGQGSGGGLGRLGWPALAALMLAASLVYPLAGTVAKTEGFARRPTLDGHAFMARSQPDDYEAIRWLQETVPGTPTIVEAAGGSYSSAGRVSAFTGLPTLLGWDFHEQQWRGSYAEQGKRKAEIDAIYSSYDRAVVEGLLRQYGVTYVYVGPLERETYGKFGAAALEKFAAFMDVAHRNNGVTIYRVRG